MKAQLKRLCERLDIWDLVRLLAGHFHRYRHDGLQIIAMTHIFQPRRSSALTLGIVNATVLLRRWARMYTYVKWRYISSYARWKFRQSTTRNTRAPETTVTFSLLCPSRARVLSALNLIDSVCRTAAHPEKVEILFYVDADDPSLTAYQSAFANAPQRFSRLKRCVLIVGEPKTVSVAWNVLARAATGDILMMANDDQAYVDFGWDERAGEALRHYPDKIVCMFFDAGQYAGYAAGADFPLVTRRWFEVLGYFAPEMFEFWANDWWIIDIAVRLGRLHPIKGIRVDHLHYSEYLSLFDETYKRHHANFDKSTRDFQLWPQTTEQREREVEKLRKAIVDDTESNTQLEDTPPTAPAAAVT
jgi:hypothetical protein